MPRSREICRTRIRLALSRDCACRYGRASPSHFGFALAVKSGVLRASHEAIGTIPSSYHCTLTMYSFSDRLAAPIRHSEARPLTNAVCPILPPALWGMHGVITLNLVNSRALLDAAAAHATTTGQDKTRRMCACGSNPALPQGFGVALCLGPDSLRLAPNFSRVVGPSHIPSLP
ncbi:hypothetical protein BV20DRAFT_969562 [Pilatotrama ljubarskyi]|nr:hypothetical protein BV20DRAFT_969562 [Pilatotrama ljubarskyi]